MYLFDTSSLILAWDTYPESIDLFLDFWTWFGNHLRADYFIISDTCYDELKDRSKELKKWLDIRCSRRLEVSEEVLLCALSIKEQWIGEEDYGGGVGKNDLQIISTAKTHECTLVSGEARQSKLPGKKRNYKIPALCSMPYVSVECISLNELIRREN